MGRRNVDRYAVQLEAGARDVLQPAGLTADQIDRVVNVGGSSLMAVVSETMRRICPAAVHSFASVFTAVAEGLALVAAREAD